MPPDPSSVYEDDLSIPDDECLYRLVTAQNTKFENGVPIRGATNAFQDYPAAKLPEVGAPAVAVSVHLQSKLSETGITATDLAASWEVATESSR